MNPRFKSEAISMNIIAKAGDEKPGNSKPGEKKPGSQGPKK